MRGRKDDWMRDKGKTVVRLAAVETVRLAK
jgi:hypothetical protein